MKKTISAIIIICLLFASVSAMVYAKGDASLSVGYINTINAKTNESVSYQGICKNDTIYMMANDIATIGEYNCEALSLERGTAESIIENSTILSKLYSKLNFDKLFERENFEYLVFSRKNTTTDYITQIYYSDGYAETMCKSFEIDTVKYDGQTYLNLEKMLYLMHAQWCVEESFLYFYPLDYNIFDFIGEKFSYMSETSIQHNSLLYDGENKWGHSARIVLSHILNDVDMRIFIPFYGSDMIQQDWYEEAILQLSTTDDSFIDDYGSKQISNYLKDSPYHKIETGLNAIDGTLESIEDLQNRMAGTKLTKFSRWNDLSTINTEQLDTLQKELTSFSNIVSTANILVDFNEINTRSKKWSDDFIDGLNILYTINKDAYGNYGKDILGAADNLLDEYENPTEEATEAAILDTCKLILDNLIEKPIVGRIESIIALSNVIIKSNPNCAKAIETADLMNTVHALINVENVFLNEFADSYHDYLHFLGIEDGNSSLRLFELMMYTSLNKNPQKEIEIDSIFEMRSALEMFLKTSLRNKAYVYHLSYYNKGGSLWAPTAEAKELENDIYKTYALLSELISTRDYDELFYLDETFASIYSNKYGLMREELNGNLLKEEASPIWMSEITQGYWESKIQTFELYKFNENGTGIIYCVADVEIVDTTKLDELDSAYINLFTWKIDGDYLIINDSCKLKFVSKSDNYNWDMGIYHHLPENEKFFYETDYIDDGTLSSNAVYLKKYKEKVIEDDTAQNIDGNPNQDDIKLYLDYLTNGGMSDIVSDCWSNEYIEISSCLIDINDDGVSELLLIATDKETPHVRGFETNSVVLGIQNGKVVILDTAYYGGGSIGGDYFYVKYDTEVQKHVIVREGTFRDGAYAGENSKIAYSYDGKVISPYIEVKGMYFELNNKDYEEQVQKLYNETSFGEVGETYHYFYKINNQFVPKSQYEKAIARFISPKDEKYTMRKGTLTNPLGI